MLFFPAFFLGGGAPVCSYNDDCLVLGALQYLLHAYIDLRSPREV